MRHRASDLVEGSVTVSAACPSDDELAAFAEGATSPEIRARIEAHVADCPNCSAVIAAFVRDFDGLADGTSDTVATDPNNDSTLISGTGAGRPNRVQAGASPDGRYLFGEAFGAGGLGLVRRAEDRRLHRQVAVKELLLLSPDAERRFLREAAITARLQHPAIVPIYDIGKHPSGEPFYCMKLIDGRTLEQAIRECDGLLARLGLLEHVIAAADAIAYAHRHHVIHRDLKPANILIGEVGETVVIDWGLAKDLSGEIEDELAPQRITNLDPTPLTQAGAVMGTLRYMPPEQAGGGGEVDERSDVYALGAVLFHVLAGEAPHAGRKGTELLVEVAEGKVEDLHALVSDAPTELIAITHKAMAINPNDRYASASDFAEDLRRFRTGRMVGAHHYSTGEVLRRWVRRHRSLVAVVSISLTVLAAFGVYGVQNIRRERDAAERASAIAAEEEARALAAEAEAQRQRAAAREQLLATLNARAIDAVRLGAANEALLAAGSVLAIREDPTARGAMVAGASGLFEPRLWAAPLLDRPNAMAWHPVAGVLVVEAERVERWTASGEALAPLTGGAFSYTIEPSPDGQRIALHTGGALAIYEPAVRTDAPVLRLGADGRYPNAYGFVWRDEDHLIATEGPHSAGVWQLSTDQRTTGWTGQAGPMRAMAAHPKLEFVITGAHDRTIRAWDPFTMKEVGPLEQAGVGAFSVAISPDGKFAAAGGEVRGGDGKVRIWDLQTFKLADSFRAHRGEVHFVGFSPDGRWLATGGTDETVRLWHVPSFTEVAVLRSVGGRSPRFAFAPDGSAIAVAFGEEQRVRVYSLRGAVGSLEPKHFSRPVEHVAWSPDGRQLAAGIEDGFVHAFDTHDRTATIVSAPAGGYLAGQVLQWVDENLLVARGDELALLDPTTGALRESIGSTPQPHQMSKLENSRVLMHDNREIFFLRFDHGHAIRERVECPPAWDNQLTEIIGPWTPDGTAVLVTLMKGQIVQIPADGSPCTVIGPAELNAGALQIDPSGQLVAVSTGEELRLYEWPSWTLRGRLEQRRSTIWTMRFSSDGRWFFTADWSGIVSAWRIPERGSEAKRRAKQLDEQSLGARWQAHQNRIWTMELAPDGRFLATGSADRTLRTWDLEPLFLARADISEWIEARIGEAPGVDSP